MAHDDFKKSIKYSILFHLVSFFLLGSFLAISPSFKTLSENTIKVNIVAMPDKTLDELKKKKEEAKLNNEETLDFNELAKKLSMQEEENKGNILNDGDSLVGVKQSITRTILEEYMVSLRDAIKPNWLLPASLREKSLSDGCQIKIFLDRDGNLVNVRILKASSIAAINERALQSVRKSAPFKGPPSEIVDDVLKGTIVLAFPL